MSDSLLGQSPMAPAAPRRVPGTGSGVGDADAGGVWAQTSAKRDRLSELKIELPEDKVSLDQMATPAQALDLHLADGLGLVARAVDGAWGAQRQTGAGADADLTKSDAVCGWSSSVWAAFAAWHRTSPSSR